MLKQYKYTCNECLINIPEHRDASIWNGELVCTRCFNILEAKAEATLPILKSKYDNVQKPQHYHRYDMDTITFLKQGFPPEVYKGFCIGNVIKYTQRYELKNGQEDLDKAAFYQKELVEWVKKNHS